MMSSTLTFRQQLAQAVQERYLAEALVLAARRQRDGLHVSPDHLGTALRGVINVDGVLFGLQACRLVALGELSQAASEEDLLAAVREVATLLRARDDLDEAAVDEAIAADHSAASKRVRVTAPSDQATGDRTEEAPVDTVLPSAVAAVSRKRPREVDFFGPNRRTPLSILVRHLPDDFRRRTIQLCVRSEPASPAALAQSRAAAACWWIAQCTRLGLPVGVYTLALAAQTQLRMTTTIPSSSITPLLERMLDVRAESLRLRQLEAATVASSSDSGAVRNSEARDRDVDAVKEDDGDDEDEDEDDTQDHDPSCLDLASTVNEVLEIDLQGDHDSADRPSSSPTSVSRSTPTSGNLALWEVLQHGILQSLAALPPGLLPSRLQSEPRLLRGPLDLPPHGVALALGLAAEAARRGRQDGSKHGAVLMRDGHVLAVGFNHVFFQWPRARAHVARTLRTMSHLSVPAQNVASTSDAELETAIWGGRPACVRSSASISTTADALALIPELEHVQARKIPIITTAVLNELPEPLSDLERQRVLASARKHVLHAEVHCLQQLASLEDARGAEILVCEIDTFGVGYDDAQPCRVCTKALASVGIGRVLHTTQRGLAQLFIRERAGVVSEALQCARG